MDSERNHTFSTTTSNQLRQLRAEFDSERTMTRNRTRNSNSYSNKTNSYRQQLRNLRKESPRWNLVINHHPTSMAGGPSILPPKLPFRVCRSSTRSLKTDKSIVRHCKIEAGRHHDRPFTRFK